MSCCGQSEVGVLYWWRAIWGGCGLGVPVGFVGQDLAVDHWASLWVKGGCSEFSENNTMGKGHGHWSKLCCASFPQSHTVTFFADCELQRSAIGCETPTSALFFFFPPSPQPGELVAMAITISTSFFFLNYHSMGGTVIVRQGAACRAWNMETWKGSAASSDGDPAVSKHEPIPSNQPPPSSRIDNS